MKMSMKKALSSLRLSISFCVSFPGLDGVYSNVLWLLHKQRAHPCSLRIQHATRLFPHCACCTVDQSHIYGQKVNIFVSFIEIGLFNSDGDSENLLFFFSIECTF